MNLSAIHLVLATPRCLDHSAFSTLFRKAPSISLVAAETDLAAAIAACESRPTDVALLDLAFPGDAALRVGAALIQRCLVKAVGFLDDDIAVARARKALKVPKSGYFTRREDIYGICEGLRAILTPASTDSRDIPPSHYLPSVTELPNRDVHGLLKLSEREMDILERLACGNTVKQTAGQLGLAESTVDNHKARIMKKLNVGHMTQLTRIAIHTGLID